MIWKSWPNLAQASVKMKKDDFSIQLRKKSARKNFYYRTFYFLFPKERKSFISYWERKEFLEENVARVTNFKSGYLGLNSPFSTKELKLFLIFCSCRPQYILCKVTPERLKVFFSSDTLCCYSSSTWRASVKLLNTRNTSAELWFLYIHSSW